MAQLIRLMFVAVLIACCGESNDNDVNTDDSTVDSDTLGDTDPKHPLERISIVQSSKISTVAIVTWPDDLDGIDVEDIEEAYIEYGLGDSLDKTAPVDLSAKNMRTVVLGMKAGALTYSIQSTVVVDDVSYTSPVHSFETGYAPTGIAVSAEAYRHVSLPIDEGYLLLGAWSSFYSIIVDTDGDPVWWTEGPKTGDAGTSEILMDWDGKFMYLMPTNPNWTDAKLYRVSMDGEDVEKFDIGKGHHSFKPVPDGGVIFVQQTEDTCDAIMHLDKDGDITEVLRWSDFISDFDHACHTNYVGYVEDSNSIYLSSRDYDIAAYGTWEGELIWALGRDEYQNVVSEDFRMDDEHDIIALHGLHVWNGGKNCLLFNNRATEPAHIYEYEIKGDSADINWEYERDGAHSTQLGNAERLPSGNTLVVYSVAGIINQVSEDKTVVQRIDFSEPLGYGHWRPNLYGPPPKM